MGQFEINGNLAEYKGLSNCETFIQTVCRVRSYMMAYAYGKRVSDFKRQPAISHGGSMEAFAGRNSAVQDHG